MKRKTKTIMPRRMGAAKLRRPVLSESDVDATEPSSPTSTPDMAKRAVKRAESPRTRKSNSSPAERANNKRNSTSDPLTAPIVPANAASSRAMAPPKSPAKRTSPLRESPTAKVSTSQAAGREDKANNSRARAKAPLASLDPSIIDDLKTKFQELSMLRSTAAEALLAEYKVSAEARIAAAEKMIAALRSENELLLHKQNGPSTERHGRASDISTLSREGGTNSGPLIELYRGLSGMHIATDLEDEKLWHCRLDGRHGEFTFDLRLDGEGTQYEYRPTFLGSAPIASRLPAYLQEEIAFDVDQLQLFFWRALNFLMTLPAK